MNRKVLAGLAVAATLSVSVCPVGSGNDRRKEISSTRRVVIDGRAFVSAESSPDGQPFPEKEIDVPGIRLPGGVTLAGESPHTHPAFEGRLRISPTRVPPEVPRLPEGLNAEHSLRMEGEGTPVYLVFGTLGTAGPSSRSRMLSSGWESLSAGKAPGGMHVLQIRCGKETSIAFLDEAEGTFLLFREVGR